MPAHPRSRICDFSEVSDYHVTTRCVRRAFLCGKDILTNRDYGERKDWLEARIAKLIGVFFVDVLAYAILSNHMHIYFRVRPDKANLASNEEIVSRWWKLFPHKVGPETEAAMKWSKIIQESGEDFSFSPKMPMRVPGRRLCSEASY